MWRLSRARATYVDYFCWSAHRYLLSFTAAPPLVTATQNIPAVQAPPVERAAPIAVAAAVPNNFRLINVGLLARLAFSCIFLVQRDMPHEFQVGIGELAFLVIQKVRIMLLYFVSVTILILIKT